MPFEVLVVLALASYRLTRIVTADRISEPARELLYRWAYEDVPGARDPVPRARWRTWVYDLAWCPLCLGVWMSAAVYAAWRWWGWSRWLLVVAAVAGAQAVLAQRGDE